MRVGRRYLSKSANEVEEEDIRLFEGRAFQGKANAKPQGRHVTWN